MSPSDELCLALWTESVAFPSVSFLGLRVYIVTGPFSPVPWFSVYLHGLLLYFEFLKAEAMSHLFRSPWSQNQMAYRLSSFSFLRARPVGLASVLVRVHATCLRCSCSPPTHLELSGWVVQSVSTMKGSREEAAVDPGDETELSRAAM